MASVFPFKSYHNRPEKTLLYENIRQLIMGTHQATKDDIAVLKDIIEELSEFD